MKFSAMPEKWDHVTLNLSAGEQLMETQSAAEQVIYTVKKA